MVPTACGSKAGSRRTAPDGHGGGHPRDVIGEHPGRDPVDLDAGDLSAKGLDSPYAHPRGWYAEPERELLVGRRPVGAQISACHLLGSQPWIHRFSAAQPLFGAPEAGVLADAGSEAKVASELGRLEQGPELSRSVLLGRVPPVKRATSSISSSRVRFTGRGSEEWRLASRRPPPGPDRSA